MTMKSASMLESNESKGLSVWGRVHTAVLLSGVGSVASPAGLRSVTLVLGPASTTGGLLVCPDGRRVIISEALPAMISSTCRGGTHHI